MLCNRDENKKCATGQIGQRAVVASSFLSLFLSLQLGAPTPPKPCEYINENHPREQLTIHGRWSDPQSNLSCTADPLLGYITHTSSLQRARWKVAGTKERGLGSRFSRAQSWKGGNGCAPVDAAQTCALL